MSKILVIGGYADSLIRFRGDMLREMVILGHEVKAGAPCANESIKKGLKNIGVDYIDIPLDRTGSNPFKDLKTFITIFCLLLKQRPDIVLSYTIKPVIYGSIAAHIIRTPLICSMITGLGYVFADNSQKKRIVNTIARELYRIALSCNNWVFFQNPDNQLLFHELEFVRDKTKSVLINGSGINLEQFPLTGLPSSMNFLLIARLIRDKGIMEYAEAARLLKERYPWANFKVVGWIDENPTAIDRNDMQTWLDAGYIEYLGHLDDVRPALADTSVFVLPSYYPEGIPRTILEAMAMGRPVITTNAPGCRETVIDGVNGFLVPTRDSHQLANAMETFIRQPELIPSMGKRSREIAEKKFDVKKVNAVILNTLGLSYEKNI